MTKFNRLAFHSFLLDYNVIGFNSNGITLKSGRTSYWYANFRNLTDTVGTAQILTRHLLDFVEDLNIKFDFFYGVPEGATKLSVLANYIWGQNNNNPDQPLVIGRTQPKSHGDPKDRYFIGPIKKNQKVIVIEDVTTTGESLIKSIENMQNTGLCIKASIALFNRMQKRYDNKGVMEKINEMGFEYHSLTDAYDFLPFYISKTHTPLELSEKIINEMNETGVKHFALLKTKE